MLEPKNDSKGRLASVTVRYLNRSEGANAIGSTPLTVQQNEPAVCQFSTVTQMLLLTRLCIPYLYAMTGRRKEADYTELPGVNEQPPAIFTRYDETRKYYLCF